MSDWEEVMKQELHAVQGLIKEAEEAATKRERERILALLEKLRDSEYGELLTFDELTWLIKGDKID
jgi:hypothetical protein